MLQTNEQGKNIQGQINEKKIGNLPEKEFTVMRSNTTSLRDSRKKGKSG